MLGLFLSLHGRCKGGNDLSRQLVPMGGIDLSTTGQRALGNFQWSKCALMLYRVCVQARPLL